MIQLGSRFVRSPNRAIRSLASDPDSIDHKLYLKEPHVVNNLTFD